VELKRQEIWNVVYRSPAGFLELSLHPLRPDWRLFAYPNATEPANAEIRQVLQSPVARFVCQGDLLRGKWQFALPYPTSISISIQGMDDLVPSWESRLGLIGDEFKNKMVYPKLKVSLSENDVARLDLDISGTYVLLDKCGTANGALHRKVQEESSTSPPLFMLFDPHRTNDSEDCFVFTISTRRLEYQEYRPIICKLDPSWRQSSTEQVETVSGHLPFRWTSVDSITLQVCHCPNLLNSFLNFGSPLFAKLSLVSRRTESRSQFRKMPVVTHMPYFPARLRCEVKLDRNGLSASGQRLVRYMSVSHSKRLRGSLSVFGMSTITFGRGRPSPPLRTI
jgi:hypothetical protein